MHAAAALVSVLMPTYRHARFITRAIESVLNQTLSDWQLLILDDASPDQTASVIQPYLADARIHLLKHSENRGLGAALNTLLDHVTTPLVAYLPSDDVFYRCHLETLAEVLANQPNAILAYAGLRHHYNRECSGTVPGYPLQLVQCMHRCQDLRWLERQDLVTDDLGRMYWNRLAAVGPFAASGQVSCEWVSHPEQSHLLIREPEGGINTYRDNFQVREPLRFHSSCGNFIDEVALYDQQRQRPDTPKAADGLTILLVGELAYNADRVLALEEQGHSLYGLWMDKPYWYNTVGPLPFGHVKDLDRANWQAEIRRLKPDVIYALLNWQAVPFVHQVLEHNPGIPFVWHYKEGPFISLEKGHWDMLVDLYRHSDGQIYCSPEMRDWIFTVLPDLAERGTELVLDGDLPKADWFDRSLSPRLSAMDGEIHTVVPGRPIGLHPHTVAALAGNGIHLHFYGDFTHGQWREWIAKAKSLAPRHLHLHDNVAIDRWVEEFSRYDAGWLHFFQSNNHGELRRANWDDLNYPARLATLAAAGLPMLQRENRGHLVATQALAQQHGLGLFFEDMDDLAEQLRDVGQCAELRNNVQAARHLFTFDHHVPALVDFLRKIAASR